MATTSMLLRLPLEIRNLIYSFLLPKELNIDMIKTDMDGPLRDNLFRICRRISHEAFNYYYSNNTFLLDLTHPTWAPNRFVSGTKTLLKYIRRVQNLQLVIEDPFAVVSAPSALSEYEREQFAWFLRALQEAHKNHAGPWLRSLIVLDHCVTSVVNLVTPKMVERGKQRRDALVLLLGPFKGGIRHIQIESRALSQVRGHDRSSKRMLDSLWDTVIGSTQITPSIPP